MQLPPLWFTVVLSLVLASPATARQVRRLSPLPVTQLDGARHVEPLHVPSSSAPERLTAAPVLQLEREVSDASGGQPLWSSAVTAAIPATRQVLIEARVVGIELKDVAATGIDWRALGAGPAEVRTGRERGGAVTVARRELDAVLEGLSRQGTMKVLGSPRVAAIDSQPVLLRLAAHASRAAADPIEEIGIDATAQVSDGGVITMSLAPRVLHGRPRPNLQARPQVTTMQQADTLLRMRSGEVVALSGLLGNREISPRSGIPLLGGAPMLRSMFRRSSAHHTRTDLVVLVQATVQEHFTHTAAGGSVR